MTWVTKYNYEIITIMERRKKDRLTQSDFHDLGCIMKMHGVNKRYTEAGR